MELVSIPVKVVPNPTETQICHSSDERRWWSMSRLLGKGSFGTCWEAVHTGTKERVALKIIPKNFSKPELVKKVKEEIAIHKGLVHERVVRLYYNFEDVAFLYLVLELCSKNSLEHLLKERQYLSYEEVRYFTYQLLEGLVYLHETEKVLHRDLKPANLLITRTMCLKITDFGLAVRVLDQQQFTFCGTPNFMAPEIFERSGYSLPVDIWATGCILYILVHGKAPFASRKLSETCHKILQSQFIIADCVPINMRRLIGEMLQKNHRARPTAREAINRPWFTEQQSSLTLTSPALSDQLKYSHDSRVRCTRPCPSPFDSSDVGRNIETPTPSIITVGTSPTKYGGCGEQNSQDRQQLRMLLCRQLADLVGCILRNSFVTDLTLHAITNPASVVDPNSERLPCCIVKWVDYSSSYGLAYQLNDASVTFRFLDNTRLTWLPGGTEEKLLYFDQHNKRTVISSCDNKKELLKKTAAMKEVRNYLNRRLRTTGNTFHSSKLCDVNKTYVLSWLHIKGKHAFLFSDGLLQVNYSSDHMKVIICPVTTRITFVDSFDCFRTHSLEIFRRQCPKEVFNRLKDIFGMIHYLADLPDVPVEIDLA